MSKEKPGLIQGWWLKDLLPVGCSHGLTDGWFHERNKQWPGMAMSIRIKEGTLHTEQSKFQEVNCFESTDHGNVLVLDGAIQCCSSDEFSWVVQAPMPNECRLKRIAGIKR